VSVVVIAVDVVVDTTLVVVVTVFVDDAVVIVAAVVDATVAFVVVVGVSMTLSFRFAVALTALDAVTAIGADTFDDIYSWLFVILWLEF
jgi:hypothetical protein